MFRPKKNIKNKKPSCETNDKKLESMLSEKRHIMHEIEAFSEKAECKRFADERGDPEGQYYQNPWVWGYTPLREPVSYYEAEKARQEKLLQEIEVLIQAHPGAAAYISKLESQRQLESQRRQEELKKIHFFAKVKDPSKLENRDGITVTSKMKMEDGNFIVGLYLVDSSYCTQLAEEENTISITRPARPLFDETPSTNTSAKRMKSC